MRSQFHVIQAAGIRASSREQLHAGKYLVGKVLGQGGFGITYAGLDQSLELKVAVKEYFPTGMASRSTGTAALQWHTTAEQHEAGRESFVREARKMAKIHRIPNVVEVREVFYENDTAYIVMDFVEGETLKDHLTRVGLMEAGSCVNFLYPIMDALDKAHKRGLLHRDISPDNIILSPEGEIWLLDLGAAKEVDTVSASASQSSQLVVKHGFSPPEQSTGAGRIGSWTDVYAMCATIYYCTAGKVLPDAMERMLGAAVTMPDRFPEKLSQVLERGLALRPKERIQSMDALMAELSEFRPAPGWGPEITSGTVPHMASIAGTLGTETEPDGEKEPKSEAGGIFGKFEKGNNGLSRWPLLPAVCVFAAAVYAASLIAYMDYIYVFVFDWKYGFVLYWDDVRYLHVIEIYLGILLCFAPSIAYGILYQRNAPADAGTSIPFGKHYQTIVRITIIGVILTSFTVLYSCTENPPFFRLFEYNSFFDLSAAFDFRLSLLFQGRKL